MQGVALSEVQLASTGLDGDRKYMLIDSENRFVSQRSHSILAQFQVRINGQELFIQRGNDQLSIKEEDFERGQPVDVRIWDDECKGYLALGSINEWFSNQLDKEVRLVKYASGSRIRKKKSPFETQFPDGYPVLVTNTKSLTALNAELTTPVSMSRFRPNLVLEYSKAFEEFSFEYLESQQTSLNNRKPCERCKVITIDQKTGEKMDTEVLKKLVDHDVKASIFGINCTVDKSGTILVGEELKLSNGMHG